MGRKIEPRSINNRFKKASKLMKKRRPLGRFWWGESTGALYRAGAPAPPPNYQFSKTRNQVPKRRTTELTNTQSRQARKRGGGYQKIRSVGRLGRASRPAGAVSWRGRAARSGGKREVERRSRAGALPARAGGRGVARDVRVRGRPAHDGDGEGEEQGTVRRGGGGGERVGGVEAEVAAALAVAVEAHVHQRAAVMKVSVTFNYR